MSVLSASVRVVSICIPADCLLMQWNTKVFCWRYMSGESSKCIPVTEDLNTVHRTYHGLIIKQKVHTTVWVFCQNAKNNKAACCAIFSIKATNIVTEIRGTHYSQWGPSGAIGVSHWMDLVSIFSCSYKGTEIRKHPTAVWTYLHNNQCCNQR